MPKPLFREFEGDLLGWHFAAAGNALAFQYAKGLQNGDAA